MGAGASAATEAIAKASEEDLVAEFKKLSAEDQKKVADALKPTEASPAEAPAAAPAEAPAMSKFYIVKHTFIDEEAPGKWWGGMPAKMEGMEAWTKSLNERGFYNHKFMPVAMDLVFCLWELKAGVPPEELQKVLDGEVGDGLMINLMSEFNTELGGPPWASYFATGKKPEDTDANPGKSKFFLVQHTCDSDEVSEKWWKEVVPPRMAAMDEFMKECNGKGCHNSAFMPLNYKEAFCFWELKAGAEDAALQTLLDDVVCAGWKNTMYEYKGELGGQASPWTAFFKEE